MKLTPCFLLLITFLILLSCSDSPTDSDKDNVENRIGEDGYISAFIQENPGFIIQNTIESDVTYPQNVHWAKTGYSFTPQKDIMVTAIGGMVAETGNFKFELYSGFPLTDLLFADSIAINSTDQFHYTDVDPIQLEAGGYYVLWHINESYNSVYDLGLGNNQPDSTNIFPKPFIFNEVRIDWAIYEASTPTTYAGGEWHQGLLRGLVDFKYQVVE